MRTFAGYPIQLFWQDLKILEIALTQCKPDLIIELGTGSGASTLFFSLHAPIVTFDIADKCDIALKDIFRYNSSAKILNIELHQKKDIFTKAVLDYIYTLIAQVQDKKIFLFCDNGDKPREFETFAPLLKAGDYIAVHDVGLEITQDQIDTVYLKNNLEPVIENLAESERSLIRVFKKL